MSLAVDEPILNNPFEEPKEYWVYEEGHPKRMSGRVSWSNLTKEQISLTWWDWLCSLRKNCI
jgi:hypothetical protein